MNTNKSEIPPLNSRVKVFYEDGWSNGTVTTSIRKTNTLKILLDDGVEDTLEFDPDIVVQIPEQGKNDKNEEQESFHDQTQCKLHKGNTSETNKSQERKAKVGDILEIYYEDGWDKGIVKELMAGDVEVKVSLIANGAEDIVEIDGVAVKFAEVQSNVPNIAETSSEKKNVIGEAITTPEHLQTTNPLEQKPKQVSLEMPKIGDFVNVLYEDGWAKCCVKKTSSFNNEGQNLIITVDLGDGTLDELEYDGLGVVLLKPNDNKSRDSNQGQQSEKAVCKEKESFNSICADNDTKNNVSQIDKGEWKQLPSSNIENVSLPKRSEENMPLHSHSSNISKDVSISKSNSNVKESLKSDTKDDTNISKNKAKEENMRENLKDNERSSERMSDSEVTNELSKKSIFVGKNEPKNVTMENNKDDKKDLLKVKVAGNKNELSKKSTCVGKNEPKNVTMENNKDNKKDLSQDVKVAEKMTNESLEESSFSGKKLQNNLIMENKKSSKTINTIMQNKKKGDEREVTKLEQSSLNDEKCENMCENDNHTILQNNNNIMEENQKKVQKEGMETTNLSNLNSVGDNETTLKCSENFVSQEVKEDASVNEFNLSNQEKPKRDTFDQLTTKMSNNEKNRNTKKTKQVMNKNLKRDKKKHVSTQSMQIESKASALVTNDSNSLKDHNDLSNQNAKQLEPSISVENTLKEPLASSSNLDMFDKGKKFKHSTKNIQVASSSNENGYEEKNEESRIQHQRVMKIFESYSENSNRDKATLKNFKIDKNKGVIEGESQIHHNEKKEDCKINSKSMMSNATKIRNGKLASNEEKNIQGNDVGIQILSPSIKKMSGNPKIVTTIDQYFNPKPRFQPTKKAPNSNEESESKLNNKCLLKVLKHSIPSSLKNPNRDAKINTDLEAERGSTNSTQKKMPDLNSESDVETRDYFDRDNRENLKSNDNRDASKMQYQRKSKVSVQGTELKNPTDSVSEGVTKNSTPPSKITLQSMDFKLDSKQQLDTYDSNVVEKTTRNDLNKQIIETIVNSKVSANEKKKDSDCHTVFNSKVNTTGVTNKHNLRTHSIKESPKNNVDGNVDQDSSSTATRTNKTLNLKLDVLNEAKKSDLRKQTKNDKSILAFPSKSSSAKKKSCNNLESPAKLDSIELPSTPRRITRSSVKSTIKVRHGNITKKVVSPSNSHKIKDSPTHSSEPNSEPNSKRDDLSIAHRTRSRSCSSLESPKCSSHKKNGKDIGSSIHSPPMMKILDHSVEFDLKIDVTGTAKKTLQHSKVKTSHIDVKTMEKDFNSQINSPTTKDLRRELNSKVNISESKEESYKKTRRSLVKSLSDNECTSSKIKKTSKKEKNEKNPIKDQGKHTDIQTSNSCIVEKTSKGKKRYMVKSPRHKEQISQNSLKSTTFDICDEKGGEDVDTYKSKAERASAGEEQSLIRQTRSCCKLRVKDKNVNPSKMNEKLDPQNILNQTYSKTRNRVKSDMKDSDNMLTNCNSIKQNESSKLSKKPVKDSILSYNVALDSKTGTAQRKRKASESLESNGISRSGSWGKSRPKKGDKIKVLYKHEGWLDASIIRVKRRKKGQIHTPIVILLKEDNVEDQVEYDGEKVVKIEELGELSVDHLKRDQNLKINVFEDNQNVVRSEDDLGRVSEATSNVMNESKCNTGAILKENALSKSVTLPKQSPNCMSNTSSHTNNGLLENSNGKASRQLEFSTHAESNSVSVGKCIVYDQTVTQKDEKCDDSESLGKSNNKTIDTSSIESTTNRINQDCQSTESSLNKQGEKPNNELLEKSNGKASEQLEFPSHAKPNSLSAEQCIIYDQAITQKDEKCDNSKSFGISKINTIDTSSLESTTNRVNHDCQSTESSLNKQGEHIEFNSKAPFIDNKVDEKKTISRLIRGGSKFVDETNAITFPNTESSETTPNIQDQKSNLPINTPDSMFDQKVAELVSLVMARSRGKVQNDVVENALSDLVSKFQMDSRNKKNIFKSHYTSRSLEPDNFDYDIDESESEKIKKDSDLKCFSEKKDSKWSDHNTTIESLQEQNAKLEKRRRELMGTEDLYHDIMRDWESLDDIPLGREGARMMITFGDGRCPRPGSVAAVLMVVRRLLQHAMKDARALYRQMTDDFIRARVAMRLHKTNSRDKAYFNGIADCELDPSMSYRALGGRGRQTFDAKCGFDVAQLEILFPEEMNEYQKWAKMHKEYKEQMATGDGENNDDEQNSDLEGWDGGHLRNRLAQFDLRTDQMVENWYLLFAEVRKGSFIRGNKTKQDRLWNLNRKNLDRNQRLQSRWENLPFSSVQFLHWLGFDERCSIPLPNDDVIQALAFLGYDFVGKIVEKAILLKFLAKAEVENLDENKFVLELDENEQLEIEDIVRALNDSSLNTAALYNASNSPLTGLHTAQLYFGRGFEERLELELDNIILRGNKEGKDKLSEKEKQIRMEEDDLFRKMAAPPRAFDFLRDGLGEVTQDFLEKQSQESKKRKRNLSIPEESEVNQEKKSK